MDFLASLFDSDFMPHGHCFFWQPDILWVRLIADGLIVASYYSIPLALVYLVHKRRDIVFNWVFFLFAGFIFACGTTHILGIITLWNPIYRFEGYVKLLTGVVSAATAIVLWPLMPKVIALPSPSMLRQTNKKLERQITEREYAELRLRQAQDELEERVHERTAELERQIEERQRAERELEVRAAELARSNQALDEFTYLASHDLKAPLRTINNLAVWIAEDAAGALPATSRKHLETMQQRIGSMERLLEGLLEYAKLDHADDQQESVRVEEVVQDIATLLEMPAGFRLETGRLPTLETARAPLEKVLRNLIANSLGHHDRPDGTVRVDSREDGDWVEFCVRDDGPGIAPRHHETIFELFQSLDPQAESKGSGMGLAIVKKAVEAQGGRIWVESQVGQGASFYFTWPRGGPPGRADGADASARVA